MDYVGITHANCPDGMTCKWILNKKYKDNIELVDGFYGNPPPDVTDKMVIMADFSYSKAVILDIAQKAISVTIYDHHKSAQENLSGAMPENVHVVFDMNRCGSAILWDELSTLKVPHKRSVIVDYVQDRDIWKHELKDTHEISAIIGSYNFTLEDWEILANRLERESWATLVHEGKAIMRARKQYINSIVKLSCDAVFPECFGPFAKLPLRIVNASYYCVSEVGHEICTQFKVPAVIYYKNQEGDYIYSIRTDGTIDASAIAKTQAGGGHRGASGFRSKIDLFGGKQ